jgi:hypothetical protein
MGAGLRASFIPVQTALRERQRPEGVPGRARAAAGHDIPKDLFTGGLVPKNARYPGISIQFVMGR